MHPVLKILRDRMRGEAKNVTLAIVARGGGQRWVTAAGITTLFQTLGIRADIIGGTSGGAMALLFYADDGCIGRAMVLRCLTNKGFDRSGGPCFIQKRRLLQGQPPMDLVGLLDDAFTLRYPLLLESLAASRRPIFVTATHRNGTGVIQRLDGSTAAFCREAAINTARLPLLAHNPKDQAVLWDGALSNDIPIDEAFRLGATHVLVINPRGANQNQAKRSVFDRMVMEPILKQQAPDLYKLWVNQHLNGQETWQRYCNDARVFQMELPVVKVKNQTTDERLLAEGVKAGWDYAAKILELEKVPPYPKEWQCVFQEHHLL